jgi:flavodoxin
MIIFYSWGGNTKTIASQIHQKVGADLIELELIKPYSTTYNTCLDEAKRDQANQARPELKTRIANIEQYDTVFIGYPNWWASIPMPIATLLESYDFSGKTIIPFCSHGGGRLGQSVTDIAKLVPKATIKEALSVHYGGGSSLSRDIDAWLRQNGMGA